MTGGPLEMSSHVGAVFFQIQLVNPRKNPFRKCQPILMKNAHEVVFLQTNLPLNFNWLLPFEAILLLQTKIPDTVDFSSGEAIFINICMLTF